MKNIITILLTTILLTSLLSCEGAVGPAGEAGAQGEKGDTGEQGPAGKDAVSAPTDFNAETGVTGATSVKLTWTASADIEEYVIYIKQQNTELGDVSASTQDAATFTVVAAVTTGNTKKAGVTAAGVISLVEAEGTAAVASAWKAKLTATGKPVHHFTVKTDGTYKFANNEKITLEITALTANTAYAFAIRAKKDDVESTLVYKKKDDGTAITATAKDS